MNQSNVTCLQLSQYKMEKKKKKSDSEENSTESIQPDFLADINHLES